MFDTKIQHQGSEYRVSIDLDRELDNGAVCAYWNRNGGPVSRTDINPMPNAVLVAALVELVKSDAEAARKATQEDR